MLAQITKRFFHNKIILLGAPGVGKGSYASRAAKALNIPHLTTGDFIRKEIAEQTELGKEFQSYTSSGKLVPDKLVIDIVKNALNNEGKNGFILDGFPRTIPQAKALDEIISIERVINLTQKEEIIVQKVSSRRVCSNCGHTYNLAHIKQDGIDMPPLLPKIENTCDTCGKENTLEQREDDKEEVVRHRLKVYREQTEPLIKYYENRGIVRNFPVTGGVKALLPQFLELLKKD